MPKKKTKKSKKQTKFSWKLPVVGTILTVLFCVGFAYRQYVIHFYETSLTGRVEQHNIPSDVKKAIEKQRQISQITQPQIFRVPILMYHYIEYVKDPGDKIRISLNVTPFTFEQQIKTLKAAGYTFLTNSDLADILDNKRALPDKPILLTFDDGYRDFYTDAYPILKKYQVRATQYVIAGFLDHPNHLLTSQLVEIAHGGLVEIGAHTVHHIWMKGNSLKLVQNEVLESKDILEKKIGKGVVSFAYPYGAFDIQAIDIVTAVGFRSAVSTVPGINQSFENRFFLYRLRPGGRTGEVLLSWLNNTHFTPY